MDVEDFGLTRRSRRDDDRVPVRTPRRFDVARVRRARTLATSSTRDQGRVYPLIWTVFAFLCAVIFVKLLFLLELPHLFEVPQGHVASPALGFIYLVAIVPVAGTGACIYWVSTSPIFGRIAPWERRVLRDGVKTTGHVVRAHYPELEVAWVDLAGDMHRGRMQCDDVDLVESMQVGDPLSILYDARRPERFVAPDVLDVQFSGVGAVDRRPARHLSPPALLSEPARPRTRLPLRSTLHPIRGALGRRRSDAVPRHVVRRERGQIWLEGEVLRKRRTSGGEVAIDLREPFVVELGVWLLPSDCAELSVLLRSRVHNDAIGFRTELPQSEVSGRVPLSRTPLPFLPRRHFLELWPTLRFFAMAHGRDYGREVTPATSSAPTPVSSQAKR